MKCSVSSYSFNQLIKKGEMTQLDVVKKAHEMGFAGIDYIDLAPFENATLADQIAYAKEIRAEAEKYGIEIVAYTINGNLYQDDREAEAKEVERLMGQVDVAEALGAKIMRHDSCRCEEWNGRIVPFDRMLPTIAENVRKITEYAATKGIRTCSENHGFVAQDSDRVERLYNAVAHENFGILVDVGNFACVDENSAHAVSRLAPYAIHVHVKDFRVRPFGTKVPEDCKGKIVTRGCNLLFGCAVGEGDIPVAQCVAILKRAKYDGFLTIEYEGVEACEAAIERGLKYLKEYV